MYKTIALTVMLMFSTIAAADDSIGIIVASRGETTSNDITLIGQGSKVFVDDVISTGLKSFVVIQLNDGTKITVRPNSSIKIDEYAYQSNKDNQMKVNLTQGGLRIITGAIAKSNPENYILETPVALMGVRGTEFSIMLCEDEICIE